MSNEKFVVEFTKKWGCYNPGDVAAFHADQARKLTGKVAKVIRRISGQGEAPPDPEPKAAATTAKPKAPAATGKQGKAGAKTAKDAAPPPPPAAGDRQPPPASTDETPDSSEQTKS